jgi:hypothetical protein
MIKSIVQGGRYLQVTGGNPINPYIPPGGQMSGMVRYNTNTNVMEVYDGVSWKEISNNYSTIELDDEAIRLLDWAKAKMIEEQMYQNLAESHPAVKVALENLEKAKQQLDVTIILSKEHEQTTS